MLYVIIMCSKGLKLKKQGIITKIIKINVKKMYVLRLSLHSLESPMKHRLATHFL